MRYTLRFALLIAAAANLTPAADKPDFSGNWKMDLNQSDFGGSPPPESFSRKIEHAEPSLISLPSRSSDMRFVSGPPVFVSIVVFQNDSRWRNTRSITSSQ